MAFIQLGPEDSEAILQLINAIEIADGTPLRTSEAEVAGFFDSAMTWNAIGMWDDEHTMLVAFGLARMVHMGGEVRLSGGVHPDWRGRGIGRELAARQVESGRSIGGVTAVVHVDSSNPELADILQRSGFERSHEYVQLRKNARDFPSFEVPPGIRIEDLTPELETEVLKFHNAAQAQAGGETVSPEVWSAEHSFIDRRWSKVALDVRGDRPRVAAFIVCERYEDEWPILGWSEGYIAEVALGVEWRGLNLVSSMLSRMVEALREDGIEYVGVDMLDGDYLLATFIDRGFETTGITEVYAASI